MSARFLGAETLDILHFETSVSCLHEILERGFLLPQRAVEREVT